MQFGLCRSVRTHSACHEVCVCLPHASSYEELYVACVCLPHVGTACVQGAQGLDVQPCDPNLIYSKFYFRGKRKRMVRVCKTLKQQRSKRCTCVKHLLSPSKDSISKASHIDAAFCIVGSQPLLFILSKQASRRVADACLIQRGSIRYFSHNCSSLRNGGAITKLV